MGPDGGFITGSDILMDGGVTAAYWYGDLAEVRASHCAHYREPLLDHQIHPGDQGGTTRVVRHLG